MVIKKELDLGSEEEENSSGEPSFTQSEALPDEDKNKD